MGLSAESHERRGCNFGVKVDATSCQKVEAIFSHIEAKLRVDIIYRDGRTETKELERGSDEIYLEQMMSRARIRSRSTNMSSKYLPRLGAVLYSLKNRT